MSGAPYSLVHTDTKIQEHPEQRKCCTLKRALVATGVSLVVIILVGFLVLQFWYLPEQVQQSIDNSQISVVSTLITNPGSVTFHLNSILQSDATSPFDATIHSSTYTFRFCPPTDTGLPIPTLPCTYDTENSTLGECDGPTLYVGAGNSGGTIDSMFTVTNLDNFGRFSKFLFASPNMSWQVEATLSVTVTIIGIPFEVQAIHFKKNATLSGLSGLPGIISLNLDIFANTSLDPFLPIINSTFLINNPGSTSFVPVGDLRYVWFYGNPNNFTYQNYTIPFAPLAAVICPNASIYAGPNIVPTIGPILPQPSFDVFSFFLQNYLSGLRTVMIGWQTMDWECCNVTIPAPPVPPVPVDYYRPDLLDQLSYSMQIWREASGVAAASCTCQNASSLPLYNSFMQNFVIVGEFIPPNKAQLLERIAIPTTNLIPGGTEFINITFSNPFTSKWELNQLSFILFYQSLPVLFFSDGRIEGIALVKVDGHSSKSFQSTTKASFYHYTDPTQAAVLQDFFDLLKNGTSALVAVANSSMSYKLEPLVDPLPLVYSQDSLLLLPL